MRNIRILSAFTFALLSVGAAAEQVSGNVVYRYEKDPITDENVSLLAVPEINDTEANTAITIRCKQGVPAVLFVTKQRLFEVDEELYPLEWPSVIYRMDALPAYTIPQADLYTWGNSDEIRQNILALGDTEASKFITSAMKAQKVVVRIKKTGGDRREVTYTFPVKGFAAAYNGIKACK